eukprot:235410-Lingulodinium_polyedra.AAC.1
MPRPTPPCSTCGASRTSEQRCPSEEGRAPSPTARPKCETPSWRPPAPTSAGAWRRSTGRREMRWRLRWSPPRP